MHIPFKLFQADQARPLFSGKDPETLILRLHELQNDSSQSVRMEFNNPSGQTIVMDKAPVGDVLTFLIELALNDEAQEDAGTEFVRTLIHTYVTDIQHMTETCHKIQPKS